MRKYRNEWDRMHEQAKFYKENYPKGTRIMLLSMGADIHRIPDHTRGTVRFVDDTGTLHCSFDNGHSHGIIPGEDCFRKLTDAEFMEEQGVQNNDDEDYVMEMGR